MAYDFRMPDVGEGIAEGEVLRWFFEVGDKVDEDAPLVEVQTDKAVVEIPSPSAGLLLKRGAEEGEIIDVGKTLAIIGNEESDVQITDVEPAAPFKEENSHTAAPIRDVEVVQAQVNNALDNGSFGKESLPRILAMPSVRKLARDLSVDISLVQGSGPAGRILAEDVRSYVDQPKLQRRMQSAPTLVREIDDTDVDHLSEDLTLEPVASENQGDVRVPLRGLRRKIAAHMVESVSKIPHVTTFDEVEISRLVALRERLKPMALQRGVKLTYLPFVLKAASSLLSRYAYLNSSFDEETQEIVIHGVKNIGVATATTAGLMVPVIKNVDKFSVLDLAVEVDRLANRARDRKASVEELKGSTFSVTNIGVVGGTAATPIINYPDSAILGVYRLAKKPVVIDDELAVGQVLPLSLTFDHRIIDGETGARFLSELCGLLSDPDRLILEMI